MDPVNTIEAKSCVSLEINDTVGLKYTQNITKNRNRLTQQQTQATMQNHRRKKTPFQVESCTRTNDKEKLRVRLEKMIEVYRVGIPHFRVAINFGASQPIDCSVPISGHWLKANSEPATAFQRILARESVVCTEDAMKSGGHDQFGASEPTQAVPCGLNCCPKGHSNSIMVGQRAVQEKSTGHV
jgi:hypothetical protein